MFEITRVLRLTCSGKHFGLGRRGKICGKSSEGPGFLEKRRGEIGEEIASRGMRDWREVGERIGKTTGLAFSLLLDDLTSGTGTRDSLGEMGFGPREGEAKCCFRGVELTSLPAERCACCTTFTLGRSSLTQADSSFSHASISSVLLCGSFGNGIAKGTRWLKWQPDSRLKESDKACRRSNGLMPDFEPWLELRRPASSPRLPQFSEASPLSTG